MNRLSADEAVIFADAVHPTHAVAVSTLLEVGAMLPSVTPQFVMRAGRVP